MTLALTGQGIGGVHLTLTCDDLAGCDATQTFTQPDYVAQRAAATRAGWVEQQTNAGRMFICPKCARVR